MFKNYNDAHPEGLADFKTNYPDAKKNEFQFYLRYMKTPGTWGGNMELAAATEVYGRTIKIYEYISSIFLFFLIGNVFIQYYTTSGVLIST